MGSRMWDRDVARVRPGPRAKSRPSALDQIVGLLDRAGRGRPVCSEFAGGPPEGGVPLEADRSSVNGLGAVAAWPRSCGPAPGPMDADPRRPGDHRRLTTTRVTAPFTL